MDFHGARAELDDGLIFMLAGGSEVHSRIAVNILAYLHAKLRGSGCRTYGSDLAMRTGEQTIRLPDVSVYCNNPANPENQRKQLIGDPQVVVEVLSLSTSSLDQKVKLEEYRGLAGVREIVFVDPENERVRLVCRTAPEDWNDRWLQVGADLFLPSLNLTIPHAEIFARD